MKVIWGMIVIVVVFSLSFCRENLIVEEVESTEPGKIFVNSVPGGAAIYLNNWNVFKSTLDTLRNVYPGVHNVMLSYSGYEDTTVSVYMQFGGFSDLNIVLTPN